MTIKYQSKYKYAINYIDCDKVGIYDICQNNECILADEISEFQCLETILNGELL